MRRAAIRRWLTTLVFLGCLVCLDAHAVLAQRGVPAEPPAPSELLRSSADVNIMRAQIELALTHERDAYRMLLEGGRHSDQVTAAKETVQRGYVLVRFFVSGCDLNLGSRRYFKDPIVEMSKDKALRIMQTIGGARESADIDRAVNLLARAISMLEELLLIL